MNVGEILYCSGPTYGYAADHPQHDDINDIANNPERPTLQKRLSRDGGVFRDADQANNNNINNNNGYNMNYASGPSSSYPVGHSNYNNNHTNSMMVHNNASQYYYPGSGGGGGPNRVTSLLNLNTTTDEDGSTIGSTVAESTVHNRSVADDTAEPSQQGQEAVVTTSVDPTDASYQWHDQDDDTNNKSYSTKQKQRGRRHSSKAKSRSTTNRSRSNSNTRRQNANDGNNNNIGNRRYSIAQLVECLGSGQDVSSLPPELERRVLDFRLAQGKRLDKHGTTQKWGIFGMYAHLANVRTDLEWAEDAAWRRANDEPYLSWSDFDDCRTKGLNNRPWFTFFLIFICSILLIIEFGVNGWKMEPLKVNPLIGPSAQTLINVGARETNLIVQQGQWFRIFSPLILHAGLVHYIINMGALYFIGGAVEQSHGIVSAILLFVIPGVGGNILSAVFLPQYISVGASGGIFGLIGGCLADITVNWNLLFIKDSENDQLTLKRNSMAIFWLFLEVVVNIVLGLTPVIDNFTHLGGLLYGLCCGWSTIESAAAGFFGYKVGLCAKIRAFLIRFFGFIVSVVFIMITTAWLATSDEGDVPCPNCRYASCVPFPWWTEDKWWYCDDCDFVKAMLYRTENVTFYTRIDLTCPDGSLEDIDVLQDEVATPDEMRLALPGYCRTNCEEVFARN